MKCTGEYWTRMKEAVAHGVNITATKISEWTAQMFAAKTEEAKINRAISEGQKRGQELVSTLFDQFKQASNLSNNWNMQKHAEMEQFRSNNNNIVNKTVETLISSVFNNLLGQQNQTQKSVVKNLFDH